MRCMIKKWFEIKATGPADKAEPVTAFLIELGSAGVLEEGHDNKKRLTAYIPLDSSLDEKKKALKNRLEAYGWTYSGCIFGDADWLNKWKEGIKSIRVSRRIIIKPTWRKAAKRRGRIIIEIDPGMAFGTGSHASTRMCLRAADSLSHAIRGNSVLDVGTGSGILAITAARLGADRVLGIDTDPEALKVARKNIRLNNVNKKVSISRRPMERMRPAFFIAFANIIAEELIRIAVPLSARIMDKGFLILSGILGDRAKEVEDVYKGHGFNVFRIYTEGEWVCMVLKKAK